MKYQLPVRLVLPLLVLAAASTSAGAAVAPLNVRHVVSAGETIDNLSDANALLNGDFAASGTFTGWYEMVNFADPQNDSPGHFAGDLPYPGDTAGDDNHFAVKVEGAVEIHTSGAWTFGVTADNGFRLILGNFTMSRSGTTDPSDTLATFTLPAGRYPLTLTHYERTGGSGLELYAAAGEKSDATDPAFRLVGDVANGGLVVVPEPAGLGLIGLAALLALRRRRTL